MDAQEILKYKFLTKGCDLREDGSLYKKDRLIAKNVHVTEDTFDSIVFTMDLIDNKYDFGCEIGNKPVKLLLN